MVTRYELPTLSKLFDVIRRHVTAKFAHMNGHWKAYDYITNILLINRSFSSTWTGFIFNSSPLLHGGLKLLYY